MNQGSLNVLIAVGKGTVLSILAIDLGLRAKLGFVPLNVVQALNFIVGQSTVIVLTKFLLAEVHAIVDFSNATSLI